MLQEVRLPSVEVMSSFIESSTQFHWSSMWRKCRIPTSQFPHRKLTLQMTQSFNSADWGPVSLKDSEGLLFRIPEGLVAPGDRKLLIPTMNRIGKSTYQEI